MKLDLPTLMTMQSFALACAGAVLLVAWVQRRVETALALWGVANVNAAAGFISLMLGLAWHQPGWTVLGGLLLSSQSSLIWKAASNLDSNPAPLAIALLGPIIVGGGSVAPGFRENPGALALAVGAAYSFATVVTLWLGRKDRLIARRPLIILASVHGTALLVGIYSTFTGATGPDTLPSLTSLFGFIYFESIIFGLGTSIFILALVKERNEAASMMAARTDPLTGIANRTAFLETAGRVLERCRRDGAPISVMMFDLDRFKAINDKHGHGVGDDVIRTFCKVTAAALRPTDVFGRMGGEEFAVVLPGSSIEAAYVRADRIRASFAESSRFVRGRQVNATVSGGVATGTDAKEALDVLLEHSDAALYEAKSEGRNRIKRAVEATAADERSNVFRVA